MGNEAKGKRQRPEQALQIAVAGYLTYALPIDAFWSAILAGNLGGGRMAIIAGQIGKAMGYRSGTPDIFILWRRMPIFIELKTDDGRPSDNQIEAHKLIEAAGGYVTICRSIEEVEAFLRPIFRESLNASVTGEATLRAHSGSALRPLNPGKEKPGRRQVRRAMDMFKPPTG